MLILNEKTMREAITFDEVMDRVEEAYRILSRGDFDMPDRISVGHGDDTLLYMPCFTKSHFGTKCLTLFPGNPKRGLPYIDGLMILNDPTTGQIHSVLNGSFLTALRTGAVGGVGMRCLSGVQSRSVGIVGAGRQGFYQALYAAHARHIEDIYLFDAYKQDCSAFSAALKQELPREIRIHICPSVRDLLAHSDIVVTTTTSFEPVLPNDMALLRGKCFIAIGSYKPRMRELPDGLFHALDQAYIEHPFAMEESGDLAIPLEKGLIREKSFRYIGDLLTEWEHPFPPPMGTTVLFKSVGIGLLDLCVAELIYERAVEKGLGHSIEM